MYFKRKVYDKLLEWKKIYSEKYAVLLEGARRVGKSTIAETFAKNEYRSYILIDFSKTTSNILECFDDIGNLNIFFLRLQAETGITLYEHESLIIFDEVQLFPKARQAIKHLIHDGRYSYLETGSLISIKKNVKDTEVNAIETIKKIKHKQFDWKKDNKHQKVGYIAQEMQKIDENFVHYIKTGGKEDWQINVLSVLATATKAIQEQQEQIEQLKKENNFMQDLIKRIEKLENEQKG